MAKPTGAEYQSARGRPSQRVSGRVVLLVLLALGGGYVDAMSYLGLGRVFTAAMTGNTVLLALAIAQGDGTAIIRSGVALAGFVGGVAVAQVFVGDVRPRRTWPCDAGRALLLEVVPLVVLAVGWQMAGSEPADLWRYGLIAASAVAMGIQGAATRGLGIAAVSTTYITGTLTSTISGAIDWLRAPATAHAEPSDRGRDHAPSSSTPSGPILPALAWLLYAVGAVGGGLMVSYRNAAAPLVPLLIVALAVVIDALGHHRSNRLYTSP